MRCYQVGIILLQYYVSPKIIAIDLFKLKQDLKPYLRFKKEETKTNISIHYTIFTTILSIY